MKTKSKKATKTKVSPEKKDETPRVTTPVTAILATSEPIDSAIKVTSEAAPVIEVIQEVVAAKTEVVEPRKPISSEERRRLISHAAYHRALRIGFGKTNPVEDWLLAEKEVDAMILVGDAH
ncbi:MAG TPA: DUF2934 domain-containing protein [Polyangium sp.]|nr:DUF2934 domain-containing protein [Polyangium sp.]